MERHSSLAPSCCALCEPQSVYTSINAEFGLADSARPFCCFTQHGPQFRCSVQRLNRLSRAGYKVLSITKNGGRCNINWAGRPRCSLDAVAEGSTKALAWSCCNALTHVTEDAVSPRLATAETLNQIRCSAASECVGCGVGLLSWQTCGPPTAGDYKLSALARLISFKSPSVPPTPASLCDAPRCIKVFRDSCSSAAISVMPENS